MFMKNMIRILGIVALVAVIGFSMISCEEDGGNKNGDENDGKGNSGLTITGIPAEYNGKFASAGLNDDDIRLVANASLDWKNHKGTAGKISGGKVNLNVWKVDDKDNSTSYSGNDTVELMVIIFSKEKIEGDDWDKQEEIAVGYGITQVTFKNGVGTGTFQKYEDDDDEDSDEDE
jgi:hypothetical protein